MCEKYQALTCGHSGVNMDTENKSGNIRNVAIELIFTKFGLENSSNCIRMYIQIA